MKFICPYCKHDTGSEPVATCPRCHKTMNIPGQYKKIEREERTNAKEKIAREAELQRRQMKAVKVPAGRTPSTIFGIMLVMMIVGALLISKVSTVFQPPNKKNPVQVAQKDLDTMRMSLEVFRKDCGRYPTTDEGLEALVRNPGVDGWAQPYINLIRRDPWKRRYIYQCANQQLVLFSAGPDRIEKTNDDVYPDKKSVDERLQEMFKKSDVQPE